MTEYAHPELEESEFTKVKIWYSYAIESVRVASTPGGGSFNIEQAEQLRDELDEAIAEAKARQDREL